MPEAEIVLGMPKAKGSEPPSMGSDIDDAAQDMLDAIKDGDASALGLALKRAVACCGDDYSDDKDDSDEE